MAEEKKFKRLPGRSMNIGVRNSLWVGEDHLLKLTYSGYTEEYRRFYFKDIQAIAIARNRMRLGWNLFWGFFLIIFCLLLLAPEEAARITGVILAAFPLCFIAVNTLKGPTCHCRLRTAVQDEKLTSVGRMRDARKMLEILRPKILEAQAVEAPAVEMQPVQAAIAAEPTAAPEVEISEAAPSGEQQES